MEFDVKCAVKQVKNYTYEGTVYDDKDRLINDMAQNAISEFDNGEYENVQRDLDALIKNLQKVKALCKTL